MSRPNKIYSGMSGRFSNTSHSKIRIMRENLMSNVMSEHFNAYRMWSAVNLAVDVDKMEDDPDEWVETTVNGKKTKELKPNKDRKKVASTGVHSIFNKYHGVPLENAAGGWRTSQNMPLIDSPKNRQLQRSMNACTVRDLVQKSMIGLLGSAVYNYSDFMFCKYLGRIPNNYLITLRRYPIPIQDYVKPYGTPNAIYKSDGNQTTTPTGPAPMATMVTWLGTPGNEMNNIMKYSFSMPFKEVKSKFEDAQAKDNNGVSRASGGIVGGAFQKAFSSDIAKVAANSIMPGMYNMNGNQATNPPGPHYDSNKAYAGVDMIKSIYIRDGEAGLKFDHNFKLVFDYELRSYDGVNGKQAMLDLLANILTCCYTSGEFWPGAYRSNARSSGYQPMSSLECMRQRGGSFSGFVNAFQNDFEKIKGKVSADISAKGLLNVMKSLMNDIGGAILGGALSKAPAQFKQGVNALLSDTAVGFWHVTVGNPCAPMMSIGNLILTNTEIEHYGPLGIDDFPTGLRVTCTFKSGKPRDKQLIERIYNGGNDRIYSPLDQSILEALKSAKAYNQKNAEGTGGSRNNTVEDKTVANLGPGDSMESAKARADKNEDAKNAAQEMMAKADTTTYSGYKNLNIETVSNINNKDLIKRYFGTDNAFAIDFTSGELAQGNPANNAVKNSTDPVA
jgi:hypothetical protein